MLDLPRVDLSSLDAPFSEYEILRAITMSPQDKAPGPDGFTGLFFKQCWSIVKSDLMAAVNVSTSPDVPI